MSKALALRLSLVFCSAIALLAYKTWRIGSYRMNDVLWTIAIESAALLTIWLLSEAFRQRKPILAITVFYPLFFAYFGLCLAHTYFFDAAAERHLSFIDASLNGIAYFFAHVLPLHGLITLTSIVLATFILAWFLSHTRIAATISTATLIAIGAWPILVGGAAVARGERIPTPVVDFAFDIKEILASPRIHVSPSTAPAAPQSSLNKSSTEPPPITAHFRKVLVFVMETMTKANFERELHALKPNTFVLREKSHFHNYSRYFPNNQDSRTGMLGMLSSRFIPDEAYTDKGMAHYKRLTRLPSLVGLFTKLGYRTAFAVSQAESEEVVRDLRWHDIFTLTMNDIKEARAQGQLCFQPFEFENSCEDLALLPKIAEFIHKHDRVFLYQEFIWGHDSTYNEASGRSNAEYYSAYLDQIVANLEKNGDLDDTLIVVTSDHGFRDTSMQVQRHVYEIPLFFYAPEFNSKTDARLFSHIDFKDLLFKELSPSAVTLDTNREAFIIGPTGTSIIAVITNTNDLLVMKDRGFAQYAIHYANTSSKTPTPAIDSRSPGQFFALFNAYRESW